MLYYVKPHNEYICSISVDSDFEFDNSWSLVGETDTHFFMNTNNIDKAYTVAKALGVNIITVNTAWEIDPCLLKYDGYYLDTLTWSVEYWDNLPVEMINAIIASTMTLNWMQSYQLKLIQNQLLLYLKRLYQNLKRNYPPLN